MKIELNPNKGFNPAISNFSGRQVAVNRFKNLEFDLNQGLQGIVKLAAEIFETPIALITLVDTNDLYMKVKKGVEAYSIPCNLSFCSHAVELQQVMVVEDASADKRFSENPIVTHDPKIRFYAGAPLTTSDGFKIGTLCVLDLKPRKLSAKKRQMLEILAGQAIHLMELQLSMELIQKQITDINKQNEALSRISYIQNHEFRLPVSSILGLMDLIKYEGIHNSGEYFALMEDAVKMLDEKIHLVVDAVYFA